jgi:16S rRNA (uracil1498-N3)-methyltransferase
MSLEAWRSQPLIFVDDLDHPQISDADLHHYRRARRLSDGDSIVISDGRGRWCPARFGAVAAVDGEIVEEAKPTAPTTVGFAPVKGERPEWVVQKLTELGIDTIVPIQADRSVVRWDRARADKQVDKWRMIAREACMQSRRVRLPDVRPVTRFADFDPVNSVLAEPGDRPLDPVTDRTVLIGPEGGWSNSELDGRTTRSLPGGILRAETAAIAAAVLLASVR